MFAEERENKPPTELQASFDIKFTHHTDSLHSGGFLLGVANQKGKKFQISNIKTELFKINFKSSWSRLPQKNCDQLTIEC